MNKMNHVKVFSEKFTVEESAYKSQTNIYDKRLSANVVQATASALQDLTIKFRKCQSTYLHSTFFIRIITF